MTEILINIPEIVPLFPLREMVAFPYMMFPLFLTGNEVAPFDESIRYDNLVALVKLKNDTGGETAANLHEIGTICKVTQIQRLTDGGAKATLEGIARIRVISLVQEAPFILANVGQVREFVEKSLVSEALVSSMNALLKIALSYGKPLPDDVMKMIDYIDNPARLSDLVALYVNLPLEELQTLLETVDPLVRLKKVYMHLTRKCRGFR